MIRATQDTIASTSPCPLEELSIELSARCACRCVMCSSGSTPQALPNELSGEEIRGLIDQAADLGASTLSLSGGDPLLQAEFAVHYMLYAIRRGYQTVLFYTTGIGASYNTMKHIPYAKRWTAHAGNGFTRLIATTGSYIKQSLPNALQGRARDKIVFVFSLHSNNAHVHNYIMGLNNAWEHTIHSIQLAKESGYRVWVHMVPMLPNYADIPHTYGLCNELGVEKMSLLRYVPQTRGRANRDVLALNQQQFTELQGMMDELMENILPDDTQLRLGCPIDFRHTVNSEINAKVKACHAGDDLMLVRPTGDVHPCAAWKTLPDDSNVREKSLREIWEHGEVFQAIREFKDSGWMDMGGPCSLCSFIGSCKGGCPAQKLHGLSIRGLGHSNIGDLEWPVSDPLCPLNGWDELW